MVHVIKIHFNNVLRRLTLPTDGQQQLSSEDLTFAKLEGRIRELFQLPSTAELVVTYSDKENDTVTMVNDQDVRDALVYQALNPLRLYVSLAEPNVSHGAEAPKTGAAKSTSTDAAADIPLRELLRMLSTSTTQSVRQALQAYEPLLDVRSPTEISGVVESILLTLASQVQSAIGVGNGRRPSGESGNPSQQQQQQAEKVNGSERPSSVRNVGASDASGSSKTGDNADSTTQPRPTETNPDVGVKADAEVERKATHWGVACDLCGINPIVGVRWKSTKLYDFDLCPACYDEHGKAEDFTKIESTVRVPIQGVGHLRPSSKDLQCPFLGPQFHWPRGSHHGGARSHGGPNPVDAKYLDARFVRDVTMFDGTEVIAGTHFTKIWRLRNSGSIPWPAPVSLVQISGDDMGNAALVPLETPRQGVLPDGEIDVSVDLVAPERPGRYISNWRLVSPSGQKFGHSVWVLVQVVVKESFDQPDEEETAESEIAKTSITKDSTVHPEELEITVVNFPAEGESATPPPPCGEVNDPTLLVNVELPAAEESVGTLEGPTSKVEEVTPVASSEGIIMLAIPTGGAEELLDKSSNVPVENVAVEASLMTPPVEEGPISYPVLKVTTREEGPIKYPTIEEDAKSTNAVEGNVPSNLDASLAKLTTMGFTDTQLNVELLEKNSLDLRATLDDLCAIEEWDPILEELVEMGFYDSEVNRRLMFKNKGSVKHVVKELVQMYKDQQANQ